MNDVVKYLGRGLLVLALSGTVFACGDDDDGGDNNDDAGAGTGGRSGSGGSAGRSGSGGSSGRDGGAGDSGTGPTVEECIEDSVQTAGAECLACVCEEGAEETLECSANCWGLVSCVGAQCGGDGSDIPCITSNCGAFLGGNAPAEAMAFGPVIRMCTDECVTPTPDGGIDLDAGN